MKWFTIIHLLVSISSNVKILKIWIIFNFIRIYDQNHLQFSVVSYLLFKDFNYILVNVCRFFLQILLFES